MVRIGQVPLAGKVGNIWRALGGVRGAVIDLTTRMDSRLLATPPGRWREDVFTAAAEESITDISDALLKHWALVVIPTGAVTSWDVRLELGLSNGSIWTPCLTHTNAAPGAGLVIWPAVAATQMNVALWVKLRVAALVLGAGTDIHVIGAGLP